VSGRSTWRAWGPTAARVIALAGLAACLVAAAQDAPDDLWAPLTFALIACAFCAAIASVDFEGTVFIDASIVPLLLAAVFAGPAAAFVVVVVAELGAWARQRYRPSAALINTFATGAPTMLAAVFFAQMESRSGPDFYLAIAISSVVALLLNFLILISLIALLDQKPIRPGLSQLPRVVPAIGLDVVLVVAAANVYSNVGLAAVVFVLVAVFAYTYLIAQVFAARESAARVSELASSRQHLAAQVLSTEERERRRLANALHDGPVQNLLVARQELQETAAENGDPVARVDQALEAAIRELRSIVSELHPAMLDRRGVGAVLGTLARDQASRGGLLVHIDIDDEAGRSSDTLVYTVARELIVNVVKHAEARNMWVRLASEPETLVIEVSDDGRGLTDGRRRDALSEGHIGLASIEDRVEAVGGTLALQPRRGGGTTSRVVVPGSETNERAIDGASLYQKATALLGVGED
jgi:two-component system, NarL family, sensor kinase